MEKELGIEINQAVGLPEILFSLGFKLSARPGKVKGRIVEPVHEAQVDFGRFQQRLAQIHHGFGFLFGLANSLDRPDLQGIQIL